MMPSDDTDIDGTVGDAGSTDTRDESLLGPKPTDTLRRELPARLSETVPTRRAYGLERAMIDEPGALLSPRERQYVRHVDRLDPPDQHVIEEVVIERIGEFIDTDWPVIKENYPDVAASVREDLCADESN